MMTIADAARATRKWRCDYFDHTLYAAGERSIRVARGQDLKAACDRMNLLAVLGSDMFRSPSERLVAAGYGYSDPVDTWRAMIDALIAEVREACNDA